jgi:hypothetical protein
MLLYIGAYHLTFLRLFVLLALVILSLILAGVIIAVYRKSFPLFRYCVAVITVCYLAFAFSKPDYYIASYLEEHNDVLSSEEAAFLTQELSLDAAPIVLPLLSEENRWIDENKQGKVVLGSDEEGWTEETRLVEYYRTSYYDTINRMINNSDIRDYNFSVGSANNLTKRYPIKNYK